MKSLKITFLSLIFTLGLFSLSSCISTDTIEPEITKEGDKKIVLNLKAPAEVYTRADENNYSLRYVAKLYIGSSSSNVTTEQDSQRQEIIDEGFEKGSNKQMVFYVPQGFKYTIFVFADYIPKNSKADENGFYEDYFYDTQYNKKAVRMLPSPGDKTSIKNSDIITLSPSFFNNDNYDCFGGAVSTEKEKTEAEITLDLELYRLVSKVRFVDISKLSGEHSLSLLQFNYFSEFIIETDPEDAWGGSNIKYNKSLTLPDKNFNGSDEQEILFYYTFSSEGSNNSIGINFNISDQLGSSREIKLSEIPVKRNHITTIKGNLLPNLESDDPGDENGEGPIILNVSKSSEDWKNQESTWGSN